MTMFNGLNDQGEIPRITDPQPRYQRIYDELDIQEVYINELSKRVSFLESTVQRLEVLIGNLRQPNVHLLGIGTIPYQSLEQAAQQARLDTSAEKLV